MTDGLNTLFVFVYKARNAYTNHLIIYFKKLVFFSLETYSSRFVFAKVFILKKNSHCFTRDLNFEWLCMNFISLHCHPIPVGSGETQLLVLIS